MVRVPPCQANAYVSDEFETVRIRADLKEKIMARNSLQTFIERVTPTWGPLSSEVVAGCRHHLEEFLKAPPTEAWLAALHRDAPAYAELYRDPTHGFVLLAHAEYAGLYRPPHDHGRGWVIYAVQQGEIEMGTYLRVQDPEGGVRLVKRDATLVRPGQVKVFLPGGIHDTRCMTGPALLFRFTERDLKKEDKEERKVTRYVERDGVWTVMAA
jgi:hypothetical protein